jgi:molybdate transport system regulatory protein
MAHLSIRIDFEPSGSALGPGMAQLLERIDKLGSIRKAAISMDMSYRKAWLLLQALEETFGAPLADTATGGKDGGGARLTDLGRKVVAEYREAERAALAAAAKPIGSLGHKAGDLTKRSA